MKKIFIIIILSLIITPIISYADDEIEEELSESEILESIETSSSIEESPEINARYAVVIDRNSKQILYGKNETEKSKMASTTNVIAT